MKIAERIIFLISTFILTLLSLGVILIALRLIPLNWIGTNIAKIEGNFEIGLVGAVFFLSSFSFFMKKLLPKRQREPIVYSNELGNINISLTAIEGTIEKVVKNISGIREVTVTSSIIDARPARKLAATVRAATTIDTNIPEVTADIQERVRQYSKEIIGVEVDKVNVIVEPISVNFSATQKKSRVR